MSLIWRMDVLNREEGGDFSEGREWDMLGTGTLCCNACSWTNVSLNNKIQRNYKGLKISVCMHSWGKLWTTRYKKTKNPSATSEEPGAKAGRPEQNQSTVHAPCTQHHQSGGQTTSATPPDPTPGPTPTLTPYKEPACPTSVNKQRNLLLVFAQEPH